ncbi:MAG: Fe-S protein assembly co-chaperone HscB [Chloroherpetonaceae bacterium]
MTNKTYFELFGLEEKLTLDIKSLQKQFYALSREVHPDFHQGGTKAEQSQSLETSSFLNQAFLTLKDKEKRLLYVLGLHLGDITEAEKKQTPPELLMELMDVREQLEEYHHAPTQSLRASLLAALSDLQSRQKECDEHIDRLAMQFDSEPNPDRRKAILSDIRKILLKKNFLRSLARTIDSDLNPSEV